MFGSRKIERLDGKKIKRKSEEKKDLKLINYFHILFQTYFTYFFYST